MGDPVCRGCGCRGAVLTRCSLSLFFSRMSFLLTWNETLLVNWDLVPSSPPRPRRKVDQAAGNPVQPGFLLHNNPEAPPKSPPRVTFEIITLN